MEAKSRGQLLITEIRRFGDGTSIRGVTRILRNDSKLLRILWTVAIVAASAITLYQLSAVVTKYLTFQVI